MHVQPTHPWTPLPYRLSSGKGPAPETEMGGQRRSPGGYQVPIGHGADGPPRKTPRKAIKRFGLRPRLV